MRYIAFLRGINVGGKNIVKMAELKRAMEASGHRNVRTHIQSGNVLFDSEQTEKQLGEEIARLLCARFGICTPVILRTKEELRDIVGASPFLPEEVREAEAANEGESGYVVLLSAAEPEKEKSVREDGDRAERIGREIHLLLRRSIRVSRLAAGLQKTDAPMTVRNRKTLLNILKLAEETET